MLIQDDINMHSRDNYTNPDILGDLLMQGNGFEESDKHKISSNYYSS